MGNVVANLDGVATQMITVEMVAKASVLLQLRLPQLRVVAAMLAASSAPAAQSFNGFGTTGDVTPRKRELAAFLAQTSHETTRGWASAPDGPYAWGYCFITENDKQTYCTPIDWPCASGK
nr:endochitinase [Quercus suber]